MKKLIVLLTLTFTATSLWAKCPALKSVKPRIQDIRQKLLTPRMFPLEIDGEEYMVYYGEQGQAVDDLLAGDFRGYMIHRLKETEEGTCEYLLTDDRTPATGSFILKAHRPN